jgi:hypothetical protein
VGQVIFFVVLAVVAAFSYEMPVLLARLIGQEPALDALWVSVWQDGLPTQIVFITAYMIVGTALWTAPVVYIGGLLHPKYSRRFRDWTGRVLAFAGTPLLPLIGVTTRKCSECTTSGTLSELRPPVEIAAAAAV